MNIDIDRVVALMRANGMEMQARALESGEAVIGTVCEIAGFTKSDSTSLATQQQGMQVQQRSCDKPTGGRETGVVPAWNLPGAAPQCYMNCAPVSECLLPLLREARSRFDDHAWMQLWTRDPTIIHIDKIVSLASAPYLAAFPLTSNGKIILAQEDAQQLPFLPGMFKFDWKFSDHQAPDQIVVRLFTGPRGLTGLTGTSALVPVGNDLKLSDFECKDDCYFLPYPDILLCQAGGIPDTRTVYIELEARGLGGGGNQLDSINMTLFKRGTKKFRSTCKQYELEY
jgi:hypothetical protein